MPPTESNPTSGNHAMAVVMRNAATNVQQEVVTNAGHWLMEESPAETGRLIAKFLSTAP